MLAAARVTFFIVADALTELPRGRMLARLGDPPWGTPRWYLGYLITCPRCLGFWVSALWVGAWMLWPDGSTLVALPFAVAAGAMVLTETWDDDDAGE